MYLWTIFAFACLLWRAESPPQVRIVPADDVCWTLVATVGLVAIIGLSGLWVTRRARHTLRTTPGSYAAHLFHHRATLTLRLLLIGGFATIVLTTPWPEWFAFGRYSPWLQVFGDLIVLTPFVVGSLLLWLTSYGFERDLRVQAGESADPPKWRLSTYLDFNIRHQLLIVAVPMLLILFVADITRGFDQQIAAAFGWIFAPDVLLGTAAAGVFVISPILLCRIWRTEPLAAGPVRARLEALCARINLRFRDILVWKSDGVMINAAVMGVFAPVRYVLLSDALLSSMTPAQIEAVFGHEAGHIRHRHIPHFLIFAFVGWVVVVAVMEGLARISVGPEPWLNLSVEGIESIGLAVTALFWAVCFGWVSRRFERQADLFGARCVAVAPEECHSPCSVHIDAGRTVDEPDRVCAAGASIFASALERVAYLNGIPKEEPSWRHSSIGSRIRFLVSLAGDPARARGFERSITLVKTSIWIVALIGGAAVVWYWSAVGQPAILQLQGGNL